VKVDPYVRLNPDFPFSERFRVSNDGNFDINDASFTCLIIDSVSDTASMKGIHEQDNLADAHPHDVKTISADGSATIDCPWDRVFYVNQTRHYSKVEMEFRMSFRPSLYIWFKQSCFRFLGVLNTQAQVEWTYESGECFDISKSRPSSFK
jgi:hypothetical protein